MFHITPLTVTYYMAAFAGGLFIVGSVWIVLRLLYWFALGLTKPDQDGK